MPDDVLIVGAGPAGATAARTLARAGARVRLIDRARFPRNKPCGGAISARALGRFPYLETALERIPVLRLSRLQLESPSGGTVILTSSTPAALMIRRVEFDDLLVRLAIEAGAELVEGVEVAQAEESASGVTLRDRAGRTWRAGAVIAADGVYSVVGRRLGLNPGWPARAVALDMMEETPVEQLSSVDPGTMWVAYGYAGGEGYAYIFPKRAHVNVGVGFVLDYYRRHAVAPWTLQSQLVDRLRRNGLLKGSSCREHFTPYQLPVGGPLRRTAGKRTLLAGDAAGFVNGITAEGIFYAMVSGDCAARAVAAGDLTMYERSWRQEIGAELRDAVWIQRYLLPRPERVDGAVRGARAKPGLADLLVRYAMGEVSYATARRRLLLAAPLLLPRLLLQSFRMQDAPAAEVRTT